MILFSLRRDIGLRHVSDTRLVRHRVLPRNPRDGERHPTHQRGNATSPSRGNEPQVFHDPGAKHTHAAAEKKQKVISTRRVAVDLTRRATGAARTDNASALTRPTSSELEARCRLSLSLSCLRIQSSYFLVVLLSRFHSLVTYTHALVRSTGKFINRLGTDPARWGSLIKHASLHGRIHTSSRRI